MRDLIIKVLCPNCGDDVTTKKIFSVTMRYGNRSMFHAQYCKDCMISIYGIDETNIRFKMFLTDFVREHDLSHYHAWKKSDLKLMIDTMKDLKIPIIKYDQELWCCGSNNMFIDNVPMKLMEEGEKILFKDKDIEVDIKEQKRLDREQFEALRDSVLKSLNEMGTIINRRMR